MSHKCWGIFDDKCDTVNVMLVDGYIGVTESPVVSSVQWAIPREGSISVCFEDFGFMVRGSDIPKCSLEHGLHELRPANSFGGKPPAATLNLKPQALNPMVLCTRPEGCGDWLQFGTRSVAALHGCVLVIACPSDKALSATLLSRPASSRRKQSERAQLQRKAQL